MYPVAHEISPTTPAIAYPKTANRTPGTQNNIAILKKLIAARFMEVSLSGALMIPFG
jgi:hypothetical protein